MLHTIIYPQTAHHKRLVEEVAEALREVFDESVRVAEHVEAQQ